MKDKKDIETKAVEDNEDLTFQWHHYKFKAEKDEGKQMILNELEPSGPFDKEEVIDELRFIEQSRKIDQIKPIEIIKYIQYHIINDDTLSPGMIQDKLQEIINYIHRIKNCELIELFGDYWLRRFWNNGKWSTKR